MTTTTTTTIPKPVINAILIHKCCGTGMNLIKQYTKDNPDKDIKFKTYAMFVSRDNGMLTKYSIDITNVQKGISYLIVDDKIIAQYNVNQSLRG